MRAFVAIELPPSIEQALANQAEDLKSAVDPGAIRWVKPAGIHLTLKFLGEIEKRLTPSLIATITEEASRHPPFRFEVQGLGCFPNLRRPRVLWLGVSERSGSLSELQRGLERSLADFGFRVEDRPFHAHLTLGRVKREVKGDSMRRLVEALSGIRVGPVGVVDVHGVSLMQSDLRPTGAIYSQIHFAPLKED